MAGGSRASSSTERPRLADPSGDPAPPATASPAAPEPASPDDEVNLARRRFFRQFAGELIQTAATVAGAAQALQRASAEAAGAILDPAAAALRNDPTAAGQVAVSPPPAVGGPPTGFRTPFREEGGFLLVIDQRKLPDELVEVEVRNAPEAANAIRQMVVRGAPAIGQVAAIGLALSAERATETTAIARRAILRAAAAALRAARPTAVNLGWAVDRMMARFEAVGDLPEDGIAVAAALRDEADAIVTEATTDHGRLAVFGLAALPVREFGPLRILTHCNTGPLACGQFGTALGIVQAAHHAEHEVKVWVDETRPYLQGARLTAWELVDAVVQASIRDGAVRRHVGRRAQRLPRRHLRRAPRCDVVDPLDRHDVQRGLHGARLPGDECDDPSRPSGQPRDGRSRDARRGRDRDRGAAGR